MNHCFNTLRISGFVDRKEVESLLEQNKGTDEALSFSKAVPDQLGRYKGMYGEICGTMRSCQDCANCLLWHQANWGVGKDAWDVEFEVDKNNELILSFTTSALPPLLWLRSIAAQYPTLRFRLDYQADEFKGVAICRNGRLIKDACKDCDSRRPAPLANEMDRFATALATRRQMKTCTRAQSLKKKVTAPPTWRDRGHPGGNHSP
jgi:hypothetical protein